MHLVGCFGLDNVLPAAALALRVPDRAVLFFDAFQNVRRNWTRAAIRKNCVGERELCQRDFAAPEEWRRIRPPRCATSRGATELANLITTRVRSVTADGA